MILILSTWRLWTGQQVFPQIPLLSIATDWPRWIDNVGLAALLGSLGVTFVAVHSVPLRRLSLGVTLLSLALLWITDQHRLQPWAYHFALSVWILLVCPPPHNRRWLRALIVSVYLFSALSKFDARFLQTNGAMFVEAALELLGLRPDRIEHEMLAHLAIGLPLGELATSGLLAVPGLRRYGRWAAAVLHLSMFALLGPWAMNHRWGVLVWNVAFLAQVLILFERRRGLDVQPTFWHAWWPTSKRSRFGLIPVIAALVLPVIEPLQIWDSWLSWGLYSTRAAKLDLYVAHTAVQHLPPSIRAFCRTQDADGIWIRLAMDRWSLETLQVPIYPHERFQLGVALAVLHLLPDEDRHAVAVWSSPPNRRTGAVSTQRLEGAAALESRAAAYFWNAQPRAPVCLLCALASVRDI